MHMHHYMTSYMGMKMLTSTMAQAENCICDHPQKVTT